MIQLDLTFHGRLIQLDLTFHRAIIGLSGSTKLIDLWSSLNGHIGTLMLRGMEQQALDITDVVRLHPLVIDALTADTPTQAQQEIVDHYTRDEAKNRVLADEVPGVLDALFDEAWDRTAALMEIPHPNPTACA